jgi:hypothetical protein
MLSLGTGILVVNDSTLDKLFAEKMELVTRQESGKPRRVVQGIKLFHLISLLWTEGDHHIPLDYRMGTFHPYAPTAEVGPRTKLTKRSNHCHSIDILKRSGAAACWAAITPVSAGEEPISTFHH